MTLPSKMIEEATEVIYGGPPCCGIDDQDIAIMSKALKAAGMREALACVEALKLVDELAEGDETNAAKILLVRSMVRTALRNFDALGFDK